MWNHKKNFQVKHDQYDSIIFPKTFSSESSKYFIRPLPYYSMILYFWQVLESIHNFIIELHALKCLFVRGSNKQPRKDRIISNFTKGQTFSSLMTIKCSWGYSHNAAPFLHPPKKAFLSSSVWPRREYTWTLDWKESLLTCFENCQDVPYSHRQSRNS